MVKILRLFPAFSYRKTPENEFFSHDKAVKRDHEHKVLILPRANAREGSVWVSFLFFFKEKRLTDRLKQTAF